ncbi:hypothetical protein Drorol1_Dr00022485 [Drosera rotundifolia]
MPKMFYVFCHLSSYHTRGYSLSLPGRLIMGLTGKLIAEIGLKSSVDQHYKLWSSKPHHVPDSASKHVQSCNLVEGAFGNPNSIIIWNCTVEGKAQFIKQRVEDIDDKTTSVRFNSTDGDLMDIYKILIAIVEVEPKVESTNVVKWTSEYEKSSESSPEPIESLGLLIGITKDIEADHLHA